MDHDILHNNPDFRKGDDATEREELQKLAPTLFGIAQESPFQVPAQFFDHLPHEVQAKVVAQVTKPTAFSWLWRLAIAAPVAAVLFGAWWFTRETPLTGVDISTSEADTTPTIDDLEGLEEDDLLAALAEDDDMGSVATDLELTDDELLDYLEQENTDLDELINEL